MGSQKDAHISHMESFDAGVVAGLTEAIGVAEDCEESCGHCLEVARILRSRLKDRLVRKELTSDPRQLKLPL